MQIVIYFGFVIKEHERGFNLLSLIEKINKLMRNTHIANT